LETDATASSKDKILQYLLLSGSTTDESCTVKEIAAHLSISINATRQYLIVLEKEGLVVRTTQKSTTGRPAILYSLHPDAIEEFPKTYRDFSIKLLAEVQERIGTQATIELLREVGKQIADEVQPSIRENIEPGGSYDSLRDRLKSVVKVYQLYGKFPELLEDDISFALKNYNCLIFGVAKENPLACTVDESIVSELVGATAVKEKCIREGDECCLYRIKKEDFKGKV
jgi:predicted ArsR family transcriptional regulator